MRRAVLLRYGDDIGIPFARSISPVTGTNWQARGALSNLPAGPSRPGPPVPARAAR